MKSGRRGVRVNRKWMIRLVGLYAELTDGHTWRGCCTLWSSLSLSMRTALWWMMTVDCIITSMSHNKGRHVWSLFNTRSSSPFTLQALYIVWGCVQCVSVLRNSHNIILSIVFRFVFLLRFKILPAASFILGRLLALCHCWLLACFLLPPLQILVTSSSHLIKEMTPPAWESIQASKTAL